jgi:hypothetical protein
MKKETIQILCDTCNSDISPKNTGYPANYILHVIVKNIEIYKGGAILACMVHPPITHDLYFCNIQCMKKYGDLKFTASEVK